MRRSIEPKLAEIDHKLNTSFEKHRNFLDERSSSITDKKDPRVAVLHFRTDEIEKDNQTFREYQEAQKQLAKKVEIRRKGA